MACFTLAWLEQLIIYIVVLAVVIGVLRLLVPWLFGLLNISLGPMPQILNLVIMGIVLIAVIVFVFDLVRCLTLPRLAS